MTIQESYTNPLSFTSYNSLVGQVIIHCRVSYQTWVVLIHITITTPIAIVIMLMASQEVY